MSREVIVDLCAHLAAAISLLERAGKMGGKKAAPSNKMFDQMIKDYKNSLKRGREYVNKRELARNGNGS